LHVDEVLFNKTLVGVALRIFFDGHKWWLLVNFCVLYGNPSP
jgi:hypothetical protein